jgi:hypothetical protein
MTSAAQPTRMKGATHVTEPGLCARNATTGAHPPHPTHHCRVGRAGSRCRDATNRTGPRDRLGHHAHRLRRGAPPTPSESTSQQRSEASPLLVFVKLPRDRCGIRSLALSGRARWWGPAVARPSSVSNRGAPPSSDFSVLGRRSCCTKPPPGPGTFSKLPQCITLGGRVALGSVDALRLRSRSLRRDWWCP